MKTNEAKVFFGGVPTEPQVNLMLEAFPTLEPGAVIEHEQIERVIGEKRGTSRYRSIVDAFQRRIKRACNLYLDAVPGIGLKVLTEWERVNRNRNKLDGAGRAIGRVAVDMRMVRDEKLTPAQQSATEHARRYTEAMLSQVRTTSKQIAVHFQPQAQLPRLKPVK